MAHARESTPDPITAVIICALAVHTVPAEQKEKKKKKSITIQPQKVQTPHTNEPYFIRYSKKKK
jgi:hypothetical protein